MDREHELDDVRRRYDRAVLNEATARAEWQLELLRSVIALRVAEGRDHERLDRLAHETAQRRKRLRAEVTRSRAER